MRSLKMTNFAWSDTSEYQALRLFCLVLIIQLSFSLVLIVSIKVCNIRVIVDAEIKNI